MKYKVFTNGSVYNYDTDYDAEHNKRALAFFVLEKCNDGRIFITKRADPYKSIKYCYFSIRYYPEQNEYVIYTMRSKLDYDGNFDLKCKNSL